jgi:hypothetical protein
MEAMKKIVKKIDENGALTNLPDERIFFFRGNNGKDIPKTSTEDIRAFIRKHANSESAAVLNADLEFKDVADMAVGTGDAAVISLFKETIKEMKEMHAQA